MFQQDTTVVRASLGQLVRLHPTRLRLMAGPKSNSVEMIGKLRKAGMNIVRMNFSHGSYEVAYINQLIWTKLIGFCSIIKAS